MVNLFNFNPAQPATPPSAPQPAAPGDTPPLMAQDENGKWKFHRNPVSALFWDRLPASLKHE